MRFDIDTLSKLQIENKLKDIERRLSEQLNKYLEKKFKEREIEKLELEKQVIKKQFEKSDNVWNKTKNKDLRLSEFEHKIINIEENNVEFIKTITEQINKMVDMFNKHIKKD